MKRISYLAVLSLIALNSHASYIAEDRFRGVVLLDFGWDWAQVMKTQDVLLNYEDPQPDRFGGGTKTTSQPVVGAALGIDFPIKYLGSRWQMTAAYYQSATFQAKGTDYFYSLRGYGNKNFTFSVNSQRILFENKLLFDLTDSLNGTNMFGYLLLGIGAAINKASDYTETSVQLETPADGVFAPQTNTSIALSVGIGAEYAFSSNLRLGLGYRFMDLGKVSLGNYNNGDTNNSIMNENMLAQEVLAQASILF